MLGVLNQHFDFGFLITIYKAQNCKFVKFGQKDVNQLELHRHFSQEDHHVFFNDALFILIDSEQNNDLARKKRRFGNISSMCLNPMD